MHHDCRLLESNMNIAHSHIIHPIPSHPILSRPSQEHKDNLNHGQWCFNVFSHNFNQTRGQGFLQSCRVDTKQRTCNFEPLALLDRRAISFLLEINVSEMQNAEVIDQRIDTEVIYHWRWMRDLLTLLRFWSKLLVLLAWISTLPVPRLLLLLLMMMMLLLLMFHKTGWSNSNS